LQEKAAREEQENNYKVLQQINPATLYSKFEKEAVDQGLKNLQSGIAQYMKKNPNAKMADLQTEINTQMSDLATMSARISTARKNIDEGVKLLGKDSIYQPERLKALALDRALYTKNELGQKVLKPSDQIMADETLFETVAKDHPEVIDSGAGEGIMRSLIKNSALYEEKKENVVESPDGRKTVTVSTDYKIPFFLAPKSTKTGNILDVKKGADGYVTEDVYESFTADPRAKAFVEAKAKQNMEKLGVKQDAESVALFNRAYLTTFLESNKKGAISSVNKTLYATPKSEGSSVGAGDANVQVIDYLPDIQKAVKEKSVNRDGERVGAPLNAIPSGAVSIIVNQANSVDKFTTDEGQREFTQADLVLDDLGGDKVGIFEYPSRRFIGEVDKTALAIKSNQPLGQQSKTTAVSKAQGQPAAKPAAQPAAKPSGKVMSAAEWKKLPIGERIRLKKEGYTFK
jgi:hypothetical protein